MLTNFKSMFVMTVIFMSISQAVSAKAIDAEDDGRFKVRICEVNGKQLEVNMKYNFTDSTGKHITGGRTNKEKCVVTRISGLDSGDNVSLQVETSGGDLLKGGYTLPKTSHSSTSLKGGSCSDASELAEAASFGYSSSGLDLPSKDEAEAWSIKYSKTHACGKFSEFSARYNALKDFAYSATGLDFPTKEAARDYALDQADSRTVPEINQLSANASAIKNFAYSASGMDLSKEATIRVAFQWISSKQCEDANFINSVLVPKYAEIYREAYRQSTVSKEQAKEIALREIAKLSKCGDILDEAN